MVDPDAVDQAIVEPSQDLAVRSLEYVRVLDPYAGEIGDREEPAVVQLARSPRRQSTSR